MDPADPLTPTILQLYTESVGHTIYGTAWIPQSARIVTVGMTSRGTGPVTVWEFREKRLVQATQVEMKEALKCVSFGASVVPQRQFATGDHRGRLLVFDIEKLSLPIFSVKAHEGMINCVDGVGGKDPMKYGAPEIATGASDGIVKLWDTRRQTPVLRFAPTEDSALDVGQSDTGYVRVYPECWCVAFGGSYDRNERWLAMGYDNGDLKLLDLRKMEVIYEHHFLNGIVGLEFDRQDIKPNKLVVSTLQGHLYIIDLKTYHPKEQYAILDYKPFGTDSTATLWQVRHSPSSRDVFVTCGGGRLALCKYNYPPDRSRKLEDGTEVGIVGTATTVCDIPMNTQTINTVCWNRDKFGLLGWGGTDQTINIGFVTNISSLE